jgi:protein involved in polysaccharide export with SLBB domain
MKKSKKIRFIKFPLFLFCLFLFFATTNTYAQENLQNKNRTDAENMYVDTNSQQYKDSVDFEKFKKYKLHTQIENKQKKKNEKPRKVYDENGEEIIQKDTVVAIPDSIYGKDVLKGRDVWIYQQSRETSPPENYLLGPGDVISITIWGATEYGKSFTITDEGYIQPELVGRIYLKGKNLAKAKEIIKSQYGRVYELQRSEIDIVLSYTRTIGVNVVGEVNNPGTYEIPSINSAFNVLVAAKGLNAIGSVRNIYIKRSGKLIDSLDIYRFLQDPAYNGMKYLEDGDYVFVSSRKVLVKVEGFVNRPMYYELKQNETIKDLVKFAGGFSPNANQRFVQVLRYEGNQRIVVDIDMQNSKQFDNFRLRDGDLIKIAPVLDRLDNFVEISGPVYFPGKYQFQKGMRVLDLVNKSQGLTLDYYTLRANLYREVDVYKDSMINIRLLNLLLYKDTVQNFLLKPKDRLYIYTKKDLNDTFYVSVEGAVKKPGYYPFADNMNLKDVLFLSGGLSQAAAPSRIEVARIVKSKNENGNLYEKAAINTIVISNNLENDQASNEFKLMPYDKVYVRSNPDFKIQRNVYVGGEVMYPGRYALLKDDEKLTDLIERAGGLTNFAYSKGGRLYREKDSIGFVFANLDKAMKKKKSIYNYTLRDSDSIYVPITTQLVRIRGEMNNLMYTDFSVPFAKCKTAKYYIKLYGGGFTNKSNIRQTYVILPNMGTSAIKRTLFFYRFPKVPVGSIIVIPMKEEVELKVVPDQKTSKVDWDKLLSSSLNKVVTLLSLVVILQQVVK